MFFAIELEDPDDCLLDWGALPMPGHTLRVVLIRDEQGEYWRLEFCAPNVLEELGWFPCPGATRSQERLERIVANEIERCAVLALTAGTLVYAN